MKLLCSQPVLADFYVEPLSAIYFSVYSITVCNKNIKVTFSPKSCLPGAEHRPVLHCEQPGLFSQSVDSQFFFSINKEISFLATLFKHLVCNFFEE